MMKNSKLSKLLVAGVSVAMLTSALAPMAFAEESIANVAAEEGLKVCINVFKKDNLGTSGDIGKTSAETVTIPTTLQGATADTSNPNWQAIYTYNVDTDDGEFVKGEISGFTKDDFKFSGYELDYWMISGTGTWDDVKQPANQSSLSLEQLWDLDSNKDKYVGVVLVVKEVPTATVKTVTPEGAPSNEDTQGKVTASSAKVNNEDVALPANKVLLSDKITLPTYTYTAPTNDDYKDVSYAFDTYEVQVKVQATSGGAEVATSDAVKMKMGESFTIEDSRFGLADCLTSLNKKADEVYSISVFITAKFKETTPNAIKINRITNLAGSAKFVTVDADGEEDNTTQPAGTTIIGVTPTDKGALVALEDDNVVVRVGKNYTLPSLKLVKIADNKKDVENVVFLRWEVDTTPNVLADGVTKATGYVFKNNVVDASAFKATADESETVLTVVPVFEVKAAASTDVITTEPAFQTPNDEVKIYKNGYLVAGKTTYNDYLELLGQDEFKGGAFYNEEDEVFELYKTEKNFNGKWEKDTTATGIADGIYFENGVQDTKAYGLKKVVGDDSAFVYLVSDGVYKADYQGLWISEDKVWYKLDDGCCQGPANGVFKHTNGWYYNFKDGKMVETNGFELYGKDQYWFDAGECNTTGGARVAEHVDGFFYYVNNGIWDNTFNGELDGHTFVNGFAAE